jgi:hypothetical protein
VNVGVQCSLGDGRGAVVDEPGIGWSVRLAGGFRSRAAVVVFRLWLGCLFQRF